MFRKFVQFLVNEVINAIAKRLAKEASESEGEHGIVDWDEGAESEKD